MLNVNKYSIIGVIVRMFHLGGKVFDCWRPTVVYAALLMLLTCVFSLGLQLYYSDDIKYGFVQYTLPAIVVGVIYSVLYAHLFLAFMVDFYDEAFNNQKFEWRQLWQRGRQKWRAELLLLAYFAAYAIPFALAAKLLIQPANPNWRIEFVYFTIIFAVFILILLLIRLSAGVSRGLATHTYPKWSLVLKQTSGSAYVGIVLFLIIFALELLSSVRLKSWLDVLPMISPWLEWLAIWLSNVINLGFIAVALIFLRAQDELLALKKQEN
jgi:hypothetical protein